MAIEITITAENTETGFGKITKESVTLDEFKEMMQGAPPVGFPNNVKSAQEFGKGLGFMRNHPLKKIFAMMTGNMFEAVMYHRDKFSE